MSPVPPVPVASAADVACPSLPSSPFPSLADPIAEVPLFWTQLTGDLVIASAYLSVPILLYLFVLPRCDRMPAQTRRSLNLLGVFAGCLGIAHAASLFADSWGPIAVVTIQALLSSLSIVAAIAIAMTLPQVVSLPRITAAYQRLKDEVHRRRELEHDARASANALDRLNQNLKRVAFRDPLTGLLNRRGLEDALREELQRAERQGGRIAVVLLDLDDFKRINDVFGHDTGDEVLLEVGTRIRKAVRSPDSVGRVGGDEFLALLPDTNLAEASMLSERLREEIVRRIDIEKRTLSVSASLAVAEVVGDEDDVSGLLRRTTGALRESKRRGKNQVVVRGNVQAVVASPPVVGVDLIFARQHILDLGTLEPVGEELLVRGLEPPFQQPIDLFRAAREQTSIIPLDLRCLRTAACVETDLPPMARTHLNVYPETLASCHMLIFNEILAEFRQERRVCLEIHENMLAGDPVQLLAARRAAREAKVEIAIDDVGFGRSSLEALIILEPDVVKIDRRFVHGASEDRVRRSHLTRILRVVATLGAEVIAEGIEDEADRHLILDAGVRLGQGYLWGKPTPCTMRPDAARLMKTPPLPTSVLTHSTRPGRTNAG